jgi:hypothetical protein
MRLITAWTARAGAAGQGRDDLGAELESDDHVTSAMAIAQEVNEFAAASRLLTCGLAVTCMPMVPSSRHDAGLRRARRRSLAGLRRVQRQRLRYENADSGGRVLTMDGYRAGELLDP